INLRLASIVPDDRDLTPRSPGPLPEWALGSITLMRLGDTVHCLTLAAEAPHKPGVRIMNAVAAQANVAVPVPELLRAWYGNDAERIDFTHYEQPGHEHDAVYAIDRIRDELGFVPTMKIL
ncbi:MAG TPA: hypothetical protein P5121_38035, partial [Caldilineaceae bacterium]|nr:hypothetical protein [Caldilineaceae bacterium]